MHIGRPSPESMAVFTGSPPQVMISAPAAIPARLAGPSGITAAAFTRQTSNPATAMPNPPPASFSPRAAGTEAFVADRLIWLSGIEQTYSCRAR